MKLSFSEALNCFSPVLVNCQTIVIDSRLIASYLEIEHSDWMQNILKKYQTQTEKAFGSLRFDNEVKKRAVGATVEKFVWLTEEQALFYIALSKNSLRVV